jgi:DNA transformation protein and related proteins
MTYTATLDYLRDAWAPLGPVTARKMFGGAGIYLDGVMVALWADELFLKADTQSQPLFQAEGLGPFIYEKDGKPYAMSYWQAPDAVYDDPDEALRWGTIALEAARRSNRAKRGKRNP